MQKLLNGLLAALFTVALVPAPVLAQADSGQIVINVTDASTKAPVVLARVLLSGPIMTSEYSGENGSVKFTNVPDGIYGARIFKRDYQSATSEQFEVVNGKVVTVTVSLARSTQLKEIGSVEVRSKASISTTSVGDTSAQRKLSDTLADALNKISGVSVQTSSNDSDATQTISLEGQDASQTALTLDGIPLNAPGTAGNLGSISTDLFRGSSVSFGPQAGGLAGGVNFRTLEPTLSWQGTLTLSAGSYGKYNWAVGETGSLGRLGFAVQHTARSTPSLANGLVFADASGIGPYEHDAINNNSADLLKLRYRLTDAQTLTGTFMDTNTDNGFICLQDTGALPCGYGPNNSIASHFSLFSLTDSALVGQTAVQASIYQNKVNFDRDLLNRFLNGLPDPGGYLTDTTSRGLSINATLPAKERHTISITANSATSSSATTSLTPSGVQFTAPGSSSTYSTISVNDSIRSSTKLKLNESFGLSQATNAPASVLAGISAQWSPTTADAYTASYSVGGVSPRAGREGTLSEPASLRFDCNGNVAYGNAPGDLPGASASTSARLTWQHTLKNGVFNAQLYRQVQNGIILPILVNGTVLQSAVPPGYFEEVQSVFDSPGGCNAGPGIPFGAQNTYFSVPVGGVQRIYQGVQLAANLNFGNLNVQPYYNVTAAKANSADPRIDNGFSIVVPGSQLPNVPLHKAGLTLDYKAPNSAVEGLITAQYTGPNNPQNLPAYTVLDAGIDAHLKSGDLTVAANNIFNAYGGVFATNAGAVPYTTIGGQQIATIARPNAPRQYSLTFTMPFGAGAATAKTRPTLASQLGANDQGGGPGGRGRGGFNLTPLPATPPADPFAPSQNPQCTADAAKSAQVVLGELKTYVAKIEAAKTSNGYPDQVAGAPQIPGANVVYHKAGASYALSLELQGRGSVGPAAAPAAGSLSPACLTMHVAQPEDVQSRNLYAPKSVPFARPALQFMPAVGFYFPRPQPQAGAQSFRVYKLPSTPPAKPFALIPTDACIPDYKTVAQRDLGELQAYFASGKALRSWKVIAHTANGGTWYELQPSDPGQSLISLLNCGRIAAGTPAEVKAAGFDGARPPSINFNAKLGLYIVRGAPGQGNARPAGTQPAGTPPLGAPPAGAPPPPPPGMPP